MADTLWAIVPALDLVDLTLQTCADLLAQTIPVRVLLIDQGSSEASNDAFRDFVDRHHPEVLLWSFTVPLPSLSAAWNLGLGCAWATGAEEVLVVNSDVRLDPETARTLCAVRRDADALFVSALGVGAEEFATFTKGEPNLRVVLYENTQPHQKGGPDFSCFLLTRAAHARYPFDEGFIPCYGEDCDLHRRYLLNGDGSRIFSVNLPFHHIGGGSRTINQSDEARVRFERQAAIGRAHYRAKWGGPPNAERFIKPWDTLGFDGVTNPELQARQQAGEPLLPMLAAVKADMHRAVDALVGDAYRELEGAEEIAAVEAAFAAKMGEIKVREADLPEPDLADLSDDDIPF